MSFSFSQVETALAMVHDIRDSKRSAFANRLKHLQKLGFLPETKTGRGKAAAYRGEHAYLLGVALELIELGLTPERAILVIDRNLAFVAKVARLALSTLDTNGPEKPEMFFLRFDPSSLNHLRYEDPSDDDAAVSMFYASREMLIEDIDNMNTLHPRFALINITSLVSHTFTAFLENDPASADTFETDLMGWLDSGVPFQGGDEDAPPEEPGWLSESERQEFLKMYDDDDPKA